jgi:hypothetical protein
MRYLKIYDSFYKYKDFYKSGATHKTYFIDDNYLLKMSKHKGEEAKKDFDEHIKILKMFPDIFIDIKKLDNYRISVEKVDTEKATKEIKLFYGYLLDILYENADLDIEYNNITLNGYVDILFKITNNYLKYKQLIDHTYNKALKEDNQLVINWINFINLINESKIWNYIDYLDSKSWNFGIDKNNKIKMIDF